MVTEIIKKYSTPVYTYTPVVRLSLSSSAGRTSVCRKRLWATSRTPKLRTGCVSKNSDTAVKVAFPFSRSCLSSITYRTWSKNGNGRPGSGLSRKVGCKKNVLVHNRHKKGHFYDKTWFRKITLKKVKWLSWMQYSICFVKLDVIKKVIFKVNTKILDHRKKRRKLSKL